MPQIVLQKWSSAAVFCFKNCFYKPKSNKNAASNSSTRGMDFVSMSFLAVLFSLLISAPTEHLQFSHLNIYIPNLILKPNLIWFAEIVESTKETEYRGKRSYTSMLNYLPSLQYIWNMV